MHYVPVIFSMIIVLIGFEILSDSADPFSTMKPEHRESMQRFSMAVTFLGLMLLARSMSIFGEAAMLQN